MFEHYRLRVMASTSKKVDLAELADVSWNYYRRSMWWSSLHHGSGRDRWRNWVVAVAQSPNSNPGAWVSSQTGSLHADSIDELISSRIKSAPIPHLLRATGQTRPAAQRSAISRSRAMQRSHRTATPRSSLKPIPASDLPDQLSSLRG
jgi:hypothetical protein